MEVLIVKDEADVTESETFPKDEDHSKPSLVLPIYQDEVEGLLYYPKQAVSEALEVEHPKLPYNNQLRFNEEEGLYLDSNDQQYLQVKDETEFKAIRANARADKVEISKSEKVLPIYQYKEGFYYPKKAVSEIAIVERPMLSYDNQLRFNPEEGVYLDSNNQKYVHVKNEDEFLELKSGKVTGVVTIPSVEVKSSVQVVEVISEPLDTYVEEVEEPQCVPICVCASKESLTQEPTFVSEEEASEISVEGEHFDEREEVVDSDAVYYNPELQKYYYPDLALYDLGKRKIVEGVPPLYFEEETRR